MINQRTPLKSIPCDKSTLGISRGKVICLRREGTRAKGGDFFKINKVLGEGGSCVCYEATLESENKTGRLKEFYPASSANDQLRFSLERDGENHVIATSDTREAFASAREEFVESYHLLRDVIEKNSNNSGFTSFIPDFSIYYACDSEGNYIDGSTAYVWTAPENLIVFEKYIETAHRHSSKSPEEKLFTILKTVLTLTDCTRILHENGLLHLDIKPANFGIPKRKDKLLTDSITLFDVNSIYSLKSGFLSGYGTEGYSAPELVSGGADNTSDIYSIGCTLFSALVPEVDGRSGGFFREYYPKLSELIDSSPLLKSAGPAYALPLKPLLVSILKKCLAVSGRKRYQSSVLLARDLEGALAYLYPAVINSRLPLGQRLVVLENERARKEKNDLYLTFMYHLYKNPLFECIDAETDTVDVLVIGFGIYGQKFLDCALQVGQMLGKRLNVKVILSNGEDGERDKALYLSARPALSDFFTVDGTPSDDSYGSVTFETRTFVRGDLRHCRSLAAEISNEYSEGDYVFVALGDDRLNKSVAKAILTAAGGTASVNYAYDGESVSGRTYGTPVYTSSDVTKEPLFKDILRMAFNAHLIYESGLNIDLKRSRVKFKQPYNYYASISNVISIKYKLYSFGIPMDDLRVSAERYYKEVVNGPKRIKNQLIALEHRRWVCEKICLGWVCNHDLSACLNSGTSDKKAKWHTCLVKSTEALPLTNTGVWSKQKWDSATEEELLLLDPLDRMSVMLHQTYKSEADRLRRESTLIDSTMLQLKGIAKKNKKVSIAFSEWYSCLLLLWNENENSVREYEKLKTALLGSIELLSTDDADTAAILIGLIDRRFEPILKSLRYTDYKKYDAALVNFIPFILTHKTDMHLVIPFSQGSNTEMFRNVCAATVVNPSLITYLCHINKVGEIDGFMTTLDYLLNYLNEKTVSTAISFIITYKDDDKVRTAVEQIKNNLTSEGTYKRIKKLVIQPVENEFFIAKAMLDILSSEARFDALERNDSDLSSLLLGAGVYGKYPYYQFDINTRRFYNTVGCEYLKYIEAEQYLKVSDMLATKNSKGYMESPAAFYNDYEQLWKKAYRRQEFIWKKMCGLLETYHENADKIVTVSTDVARDKAFYTGYRFLLPESAYEGALKLITVMEETGIFAKESEVYYYTADSCEVNIFASRSIEDKIKGLMADPYVLCQPENLEIVKTPYSVSVTFDSLKVTDLDLKAAGKHAERIRELLRMLEKDFSFINGYTESGEDGMTVSFTYATKRIKKLMTVAGNILEIYIYHKCLKSDRFDDVAISYEVSWNDTQVKSEFDIILTKGFRGLLIEAKATSEIDQDYYFKLASLANQFCTNCKPVLVDDTVEKSYNDNSKNDMQRLRGRMLDVITVSDPSEIDSIDLTLDRILKDEIKNEPFSYARTADSENSAPAERETPSTVAVTQPYSPIKNETEIASRESDEAGGSDDAKKAFLSRKISFLRIDQSQITLLQNNGIRTVGDFLRRTEQDFSMMKAKNGMSYAKHFLALQENMRKMLENI